jgi:cell wall-associated NlpC family hydrolase
VVDAENVSRPLGWRVQRRHLVTGVATGCALALASAMAPPAARAGGKGRQVVKTAMKYKGARYVSGGASPKGFDCSGFTWYVYKKATGKDIGRTVDAQWKQGRSVHHGGWKPGDLVFFKNTFEHGLSHTGIFISGDKFIHAENENTGVVISSLSSDYYKSHYAGARRLL